VDPETRGMLKVQVRLALEGYMEDLALLSRAFGRGPMSREYLARKLKRDYTAMALRFTTGQEESRYSFEELKERVDIAGEVVNEILASTNH